MVASLSRSKPRVVAKSGDLSSPGLFAALAGIVFRPRSTLARLREARRAWLWALAVLAVAVVVLTTYMRSYADCQYFYEDQLRYYQQHPEHAPHGGLEPASAPVLTVLIRVGERLAGLGGSWALWCAGLGLLCFIAGQREGVPGAAARLTLWSWVPYLVRGLLQSGYMVLTHDPIFNPGLSGLLVDNTPPSLGDFEYVVVPRSTRLWSTLLSYADVYLLWHLALVLMGLPLFARLPRKWVWAGTVAIAVVWLAIRVALDFSRYKY